MKKQYTVVGFFEDNFQIWVEFVEAADECEAVALAAKQSFERDGQGYDSIAGGFSQNMMVIEIFEGHHEGKNECPTISSAADWGQE